MKKKKSLQEQMIKEMIIFVGIGTTAAIVVMLCSMKLVLETMM